MRRENPHWPVSLGGAWRRIDAAVAGRRSPVEVVPVRRSAGRILARDQASRLDLPPFDKAAVDGYALPSATATGVFRVADAVMAGRPGSAARLGPGVAVKVMTGAPVPRGTRRMVMVEHVEERDGRVCVTEPGGPSHICRRAEDVSRGERILAAGRRLGPLDVANLVSCGIRRVPVRSRPRIALLATGDEIVDDPSRLRRGRIMNSNGPLLSGLCAAHGLDVVVESRVPDDLGRLTDALRRALTQADLVVLSGGVSVGDLDLVPAALRRLGLRTLFSRVAVKPGRPATLAAGRKRVVFGLPGNPVSVYVMFHLFVLRAAARLSGSPVPERFIRLPLAREFRRRRADRSELIPVRLTAGGQVEPLPSHGSADLMALTDADGLARIGAGLLRVPAGAGVDFLPISVRWP
jgi:molybdopterin molybdotransferase